MARPPRNPQRSYDKDGREIPPATIRNNWENGCSTMVAFWDDCQHHGVVDVSGFPDDVPVPDVALELRCSACGSRKSSIQVNTDELHEALRRKTGWNVRG